MRTLSTDSAALALGVERKTLDNFLAREGRGLLGIGSRGRSRRIPIDILELVAVALTLNSDLGVSLAKGLELAAQLGDSPTNIVPAGLLTTLQFDIPRLRIELESAVDEALESVAEPPRGRPRS